MSSFKEYTKNFSYKEIETGILEFWKQEKIFEQSISSRTNQPIFSFFEGPPTVNGHPGLHHIFSRSVKDIVCRYKTLKGYQVRRQAGWDTHGLPVEIAVEKQLGLKSNSDVEKYGVEKFCNHAKDLVYGHIKDNKRGWGLLTEEMGYWCDMDGAYITCSNDYIESIWWSLKEIYKKGLIYKDYKIVPQDPKSESVLSSHELALGYKDVKDPSVYIKFKRKDADEYFLAWTTTPWTLISNTALCVHPDVDYVKVTFKNEILILAKARLAVLHATEEFPIEILEEFKGKTLEYVDYEPLYPFCKSERKKHFITNDTFVSTEDGTGIVHSAPAFGAEDYELSKKYNLPMFQPITRGGIFTDEVAAPFAGLFFKDADAPVIDDLRKRHLLFRKEIIEHSYPYSWRYDVPVIYYARESWFIRTTQIAKEMFKRNETINWIPSEIGTGRFGNWLSENKDWALSRNRFWGTPLPIWVREDYAIGDKDEKDKLLCIGSIAELLEGFIDIDEKQYTVKKAVDNKLVEFDLHKMFVDKVYFMKEGRKFTRTSEVIDVWYDSGAVPFAQFHYPFENKELFESHYPADFIAEGIDQTRGWFYTLHAIGSLVFDSVAFKNVISLELLLDKDGYKMSKSKGNIVDPFLMIQKYGADTSRWYLLSKAPTWLSTRFSETELADSQRKFFRAFLESYKFFALYANIDHFSYKENEVPFAERNELDRWILSVLHTTISQVETKMDAYHLSAATNLIEDFLVNQLSNWYIRRSRRRFWKSSFAKDKLSAYQTLYECLIAVCKMASPFAPFLTDEIYKNLNAITKKESYASVHLSLFPKVVDTAIDTDLELSVKKTQSICSLTRTMREKAKLKTRQPLSKILVVVNSPAERRSIDSQKETILDEVNVTTIEYVDIQSGIVTKKIKPNFKVLGPKFGGKMNQAAEKLRALTSSQILILERNEPLTITLDGEAFTIQKEDVEILYQGIEGWLVSHDYELNLTVALDTTLTEDLVMEGFAREFVSKVQTLRKDNAFNVIDKITIQLSTSETVKKSLQKFENYIFEETLATNIYYVPTIVHGVEENINGETCTIFLSKN